MEQLSTLTNIAISIESVLFAVVLFWFYYKNKINAIELILYSFACSSFYIGVITSTATPFFFVSYFFFISEAAGFLRGKYKFSKKLLVILLLPVASSLAICLLILAGVNIFEGENPSCFRVLFDVVFFYLKYLLPLVFLGTKVYRESGNYSIEFVFDVIKKIAFVSALIAIGQLIISVGIKNEDILRIVGLRPAFAEYVAGGQESNAARVSAFFIEPKTLASFLVISIPLYLQKKEFVKLVPVLIAGFLTASQTFLLGLIIIVIIFFLIRRLKNIRFNVFFALATVALAFYSISLLKEALFEYYMDHSDNYVLNLVMARAIDRYDVNKGDGEDAQIAGMPLQKDAELPVVNFFSNKPWLYLFGYGPKNAGFIPLSYFVYNVPGSRQIGTLSYNLDLKWFYFICEFGIVIFFIWLFYFSGGFNKAVITAYEYKYYAFLLVFLFFNSVEMMIILFYSIYLNKSQITGSQIQIN
jgi:hypothetical protein